MLEVLLSLGRVLLVAVFVVAAYEAARPRRDPAAPCVTSGRRASLRARSRSCSPLAELAVAGS